MPSAKSKTLFVKNLSYDTTQNSLEDAFKGCSSARIATDRETGRSRCFGFIEYDNQDNAEDACDDMNGKEIDGREVTVDYASEPGSRGGRRGGGGGGDRYGGGGGGRYGGGGGRGGGGGGGCFNCGEEGHFARECPSGGGGGGRSSGGRDGGSRSYGGGGGGRGGGGRGGGGGGACYNCGESGHFSRECPKGGSGGGGGSSSRRSRDW